MRPDTRQEISNKTALQKHILFWDSDSDNIIWPSDVYSGFRDLGFSIPFSILSFLIPFYFSYPTRLGHSWFPDPLFRIYLRDIHKAKHGSDTGIYDLDGNFRAEIFEEVFRRADTTESGGLGVRDLLGLVAKDRVALDLPGWSAAYMEWSTTWLLLQKDGKLWKDDLRAVYDGTLFWEIRDKNLRKEWNQGFGWKEGLGFCFDQSVLLPVAVSGLIIFISIALAMYVFL